MNNYRFETIVEKGIKNNFIYFKNTNYNIESYESKILTTEHIDKVLFPQITIEEGREVLKFDLHSKISLEDYCKKNEFSFFDIAQIVQQIYDLFWRSENYLIEETSIILDMKYVFADIDKKCSELFFVILPDAQCNSSYEISKLLIQLLRHIDTKDKNALTLAYELFITSQKENYSIDDLMSIVKTNLNKYGGTAKHIGDRDLALAHDAILENAYLSSQNNFNIEDAFNQDFVKTNDIRLKKSSDMNQYETQEDLNFWNNIDNSNNDISEIDKYENEINSVADDEIFNLDDENTIPQKKDSKKKSKKLDAKLLLKKSLLIALFGIVFPICLVCIIYLK